MKNLLLKSLVPTYFLIIAALIFTAHMGSKAITAFNEKKPVSQRSCVVIDAGHGGIDGGATSCTGVLESQLNLEIALRLNDLFHLLGIQTYMIRTEDVSVYTHGETIASKKISDLKNRVATVNGIEYAILISIHQNHFNDSRYSGAQVFYANNGMSKTFAAAIQNDLVKLSGNGNNRKIKKAEGIYLMEKIKCPGILIECGFLSNPYEEALLRNESYQKKLCSVIASTTTRYLKDNPIA